MSQVRFDKETVEETKQSDPKRQCPVRQAALSRFGFELD